MKPEDNAKPPHRTSTHRTKEPERARDGEAVRDDFTGEKLRSLGQLAAGVAHDFNNSLAAILGRAQLLMRRISDEQQLRDLRIIETAALDAAEAVRRIQTFARPASADNPRQQQQAVAASRLVRDVIQLTRTRWETDARAQSINYEVEFTPAHAGRDEVSANSSEVREALVNLVFNALDAMPGGGILTLGVEGDDESVRLLVRDTGRGIPPGWRKRIFEPFFTTKGADGSGLGLSISREIVERHGGVIELESEVGRGTTFTIRLPRADASHLPLVGRDNALRARRVLVVDDEAVVRAVLVEMLAALGQEASETASAAEALERLAREDFDVLMTDLSMPSMDGLTLAAEARRLAPGLRVVLTTGYGRDIPGGLRLDPSLLVEAIVSKPFQFSDLEALLRTLYPEET